jgi:hypothetical protein
VKDYRLEVLDTLHICGSCLCLLLLKSEQREQTKELVLIGALGMKA